MLLLLGFWAGQAGRREVEFRKPANIPALHQVALRSLHHLLDRDPNNHQKDVRQILDAWHNVGSLPHPRFNLFVQPAWAGATAYSFENLGPSDLLDVWEAQHLNEYLATRQCSVGGKCRFKPKTTLLLRFDTLPLQS